jgi:hypothetical protein
MVFWICTIILLANFCGGLMSTAIFAFEKPSPPRTLAQKPSFRLFLMSEFFLGTGAIYYHSLQGIQASNEDISIWVAAAFMAPLLAIIGSQIVKVALAGRIEAREKAWEESPEGRQWAADVMAEANSNMGMVDDGEDGDKVFEDTKEDVIDEKSTAFSDDDLFDPEDDVEEEYFKDKDMI